MSRNRQHSQIQKYRKRANYSCQLGQHLPIQFIVLKMEDYCLQRSHVDDKPVTYIALYHPVVRLMNILDVNHFNIRYDAFVGAEIQHLLRFSDAAYT